VARPAQETPGYARLSSRRPTARGKRKRRLCQRSIGASAPGVVGSERRWRLLTPSWS
jgi:hypothetical protein